MATIWDPSKFSEALRTTIEAVHQTLAYAREHEAVATGSNEYEPMFETASAFDAPAEFIQCLLDIVRVMFDPTPPGTTFLNANPCFLLDPIGGMPFRLGYASEVGEPGETVADLYQRKLSPTFLRRGYAPDLAYARVILVTTGHKLSLANVSAILRFFDAGITVHQMLSRTANIGPVTEAQMLPQTHSGFATDEALGLRVRVSEWIFCTDVEWAAQH